MAFDQEFPNPTLHLEWPASIDDRPFVIGLAGGSGSGKTTIVTALRETVAGDELAMVAHDAYYRDSSHLPFEQRAKVNYDHPDSLETELLVRHLAALRRGEAVETPVYDFSVHNRTDRTVRVDPAPVIVVEGILVLAEPELRRAFDLKIFVDTDADLRLMRRLRRDLDERGRSVDSVLDQYLDTVRPMHLQFVEPSKRYADIIIPEGYNVGAVGTVTSMLRDFLRSR